MSLVWNDKNVAYLRKRYDVLQRYHLFKGMQFSDDPQQIAQWIPLIMQNRTNDEPVVATKMDLGTDVNFGSLTRCLFDHLTKSEGVKIHFSHDIRDLQCKDDSGM